MSIMHSVDEQPTDFKQCVVLNSISVFVFERSKTSRIDSDIARLHSDHEPGRKKVVKSTFMLKWPLLQPLNVEIYIV